MLAIVREVYNGGKDLIPGWRLMDHATEALTQGGPEGLRRYYDRCLQLDDPRGRRVKEKLEKNKRKTLESEHARFLAAYRSGAN
jgi:hypothetical protein